VSQCAHRETLNHVIEVLREKRYNRMRSKPGTVRTNHERAADAQRQRRSRTRRRRSDVCYNLVLPEFETVNALIVSNRISEDGSQRKPLVEQALVEWSATEPSAGKRFSHGVTHDPAGRGYRRETFGSF